MQFGDKVIFSENGNEYEATVLSSRVLDFHNGKENEPLIHLAFFKPVIDGLGNVVNVVGTGRQNELVQWRFDVAHESQEFSEAEKAILQDQGVLGPSGVYPGGRWRKKPLRVPMTFHDGSEADLGRGVAVLDAKGRSRPDLAAKALNGEELTEEDYRSEPPTAEPDVAAQLDAAGTPPAEELPPTGDEQP